MQTGSKSFNNKYSINYLSYEHFIKGLNLLHRINPELKVDFDVTRFDQCPVCDPVSGTVNSYLISKYE